METFLSLLVGIGLSAGCGFRVFVPLLVVTIASPAAVVAGTLVTASLATDMSPFLKWTLSVIAGGGAAGLVQGATVVMRGASTAGTGGLANPILATAELG